jgi:hydroxymethylpyrimidine pyrophosphatase-like HAD family hydrolase
MVEKAGLGVAMGNSMLSNNKIGTVFVSDNDHNGVAEAINQYINYFNIT